MQNSINQVDTKAYSSFLNDIKNSIKLAQQKAFHSVNKEMIILYFNIGSMIFKRQEELGWGAKVIDTLSRDISEEFPRMKGFSTRNIKLMVQFYKEYYLEDFGQLLVAQIPWTHNIILIQKVKDKELRYWYIQKVLEKGWSKDLLSLMIKSELHKKEGSLVSNFKEVLPKNSSDLVQQSFKDPYTFDFLTITEPFRERELENSLIKNMEYFKRFGCEVLVGASRKSMIDKILPTPVEERLAGTLAIHLKAVENGASIIRCHDVGEHVQALAIWEEVR